MFQKSIHVEEKQNKTRFFELQLLNDEISELTLGRLRDIESNSTFQTTTVDELIVAKFRSVINKRELKESWRTQNRE